MYSVEEIESNKAMILKYILGMHHGHQFTIDNL